MSVPQGSVVFSANGNAFFATSLDANGNYSFSSNNLSSLGNGSYSVIAAYGGDATHASSNSTPVNVVIQTPLTPTTTTLAVAPNPTGPGTPQTFNGGVS